MEFCRLKFSHIGKCLKMMSHNKQNEFNNHRMCWARIIMFFSFRRDVDNLNNMELKKLSGIRYTMLSYTKGH